MYVIYYVSVCIKKLCDANVTSLQTQAETLRFKMKKNVRLFFNLSYIIARWLIKKKKRVVYVR